MRIHYDEIDIDFTSEKHGTPDYAISFEITPKLSGKLIRIDVVDPDCCNNANYDPKTFSSIWRIVPILIFARPAEVVQKCLLCPVGKFSGLALAKDSLACQNTIGYSVPFETLSACLQLRQVFVVLCGACSKFLLVIRMLSLFHRKCKRLSILHTPVHPVHTHRLSCLIFTEMLWFLCTPNPYFGQHPAERVLA